VMNGVIDLWSRTDIKILTPFSGMAAFPWLFPYFESGAIALFGHTYTGVRFVAVLFGTLTIPALYVLAKQLFDRPTALIAALFLATFPPHIHLSRLGMINAADPFWGTWMLAFLARGIRCGRRSDFVLAGLCLGMTQYFYEGGKLLFPALAGVWMVLLVIFWRKNFRLRNLGYMLLTALLVALPLYAVLATWNFSFSPRMDATGATGLDWGAILSLADGAAALRHYIDANLLPPLMHLIQRPDTSHFYYGGDTALILVYMLPLFFLGLFHAIWRWRVAGVLTLLWVALTIFGNSLLQEVANAWSARFMVVFPALALLMALGLRYTLPLLKFNLGGFIPGISGIGWKAQGIGLAILTLGLAVPQPLYYFRDHLPIYNVQIRPYYDHVDAFDRGRLLPPDTILIFVTDDAVYTDHFYTLSSFWSYHPLTIVLKSAELTPEYLEGLSAGGYGFFIDPDNAMAPGLLRAYFGDVEGPVVSPYNVPLERQYVLYYLPARTP
jgi:4-amino-4-deoxy-L-arabinose transferase-like glycosyltransferase